MEHNANTLSIEFLPPDKILDYACPIGLYRLLKSRGQATISFKGQNGPFDFILPPLGYHTGKKCLKLSIAMKILQ